MPVADALAQVLAEARPLPAEHALLLDAANRVLAEDVAALNTQPSSDVSAMDGYAVRAADVANVPVVLRLVGEVPAGHPIDRSVGLGEAVRIFTGGVLPSGTDTVVIQENTTRDDDVVTVKVAASRGKNVRRRGLDFSEGDVLLHKGRLLTSRDLMLAAAMNHATLPVHRRPKVVTLGTGDELVPPGSTPGAGKVVYSNGYALMALARAIGAEVESLGIVPDRIDATVAAITRARDMGAQILVTCGGASVGDHDLVRKSLAAVGLELSFWKVALRPGRPVMHGQLGDMHVLGLPGNPVSSYVCALLFLVPLIRRLAGHHEIGLATGTAVTSVDLSANDERMDYLRATLAIGPAGELIATPLPVQDSSMMAVLANADCLLIREPHAVAAKAGTPCPIVKLRF